MISTAQRSPLKSESTPGRIPSATSNQDVDFGSPAANDNHPFQLMALADVQIHFGVMQRELLQSVSDLVEGDEWSFGARGNMSSADTLDEGCCTSIKLASGIDVGMNYFVIGTAISLTLMSSRGTLLLCRYVNNRDSKGQNYLLLPTGFDATQTYELIAKSGCGC